MTFPHCFKLTHQTQCLSFRHSSVLPPPEYDMEGRYHGKPATVWSLVVLLFTMVCGRFPESNDLQMIEDDIWLEPGLSKGEVAIIKTKNTNCNFKSCKTEQRKNNTGIFQNS